MKIWAHKHLFGALGAIVSRKCGHWLISHKIRGNTGHKRLLKIARQESETQGIQKSSLKNDICIME